MEHFHCLETYSCDWNSDNKRTVNCLPNHFFLPITLCERNEHIIDFECILCARNYFKCFTYINSEFNLWGQEITVSYSILGKFLALLDTVNYILHKNFPQVKQHIEKKQRNSCYLNKQSLVFEWKVVMFFLLTE